MYLVPSVGVHVHENSISVTAHYLSHKSHFRNNTGLTRGLTTGTIYPTSHKHGDSTVRVQCIMYMY